MFCFIIFFSSYLRGQCPHNAVVGSNVGINTLSQALSLGVLQYSGSPCNITQDFCVNGQFDASNICVSYSQINVLQNSTITFTSQQENRFYQCEIFGTSSSDIVMGGSQVGVDLFNCSVEGFRNIIINSGASIRSIGSSFATNDKIYVGGLLHSYNSNFYSSHIEVINGLIVSNFNIYITNCQLPIGAKCRAINLYNSSSYWGYNDVFDKNYMGLNCEFCRQIKVKKSHFLNNKYGIAHLGSNHYVDSEIRRNTFAAPLVLAPTAIFTNGVNGLKVYENDISLSGNGSFALNLLASRDHEVSFNPNLSSQGSFFTAIWSSFITDNPIMSSISFSNTNNLAFRNNKLKGELFHVAKSQNDNDLDFYFNKVDGSNGSTKLIEVRNGDYNEFKCNTLLDGFDGFSQVGTSFGVEEVLGLNLVDNQISNCTNGMYFKDVRFPPQIDKGNNFFNNTMGVRGENINTTLSYFRVRNLPSEYPLHTPTGIMKTNGASDPTEECGAYPEIGGGGTTDYCSGMQYTYNVKVVKSLFQCYYSSVSMTGRCHKNIKRALELIKRCPNLLNDSIVNSQFNFIKTTDAAKMFDFYALREKIHVSYIPMNYNFPFVNALPTNAQISDLNNAMQIKSANDAISDALKLSKINTEINLINTTLVSEATVSVYKSALLWYLEYAKGIVPSSQRLAQIKDSAENCDEYGSPGHDVAVFLCTAFEIAFDNDVCVTPRSKENVPNELKIYPNPTSDFLFINGKFDSSILTICDVMGKAVGEWVLVDESILDISRLASGIYFINIGKSNFKIIKI